MKSTLPQIKCENCGAEIRAYETTAQLNWKNTGLCPRCIRGNPAAQRKLAAFWQTPEEVWEADHA